MIRQVEEIKSTSGILNNLEVIKSQQLRYNIEYSNSKIFNSIRSILKSFPAM